MDGAWTGYCVYVHRGHDAGRCVEADRRKKGNTGGSSRRRGLEIKINDKKIKNRCGAMEVAAAVFYNRKISALFLPAVGGRIHSRMLAECFAEMELVRIAYLHSYLTNGE